MPADLERRYSPHRQAEWCCLGTALFCAVYALWWPPQLLLAPILASLTLSVVGGALSGLATAMRTQEQRVRHLERELAPPAGLPVVTGQGSSVQPLRALVAALLLLPVGPGHGSGRKGPTPIVGKIV